jgi:hypothetical protein
MAGFRGVWSVGYDERLWFKVGHFYGIFALKQKKDFWK